LAGCLNPARFAFPPAKVANFAATASHAHSAHHHWGDYLVNAIMACSKCPSPCDASGHHRPSAQFRGCNDAIPISRFHREPGSCIVLNSG
jgi:hypothetical protein